MLDEPLHPDQARRLIRHILATGTVEVGDHAKEELAKDGLTMVDAVNVLRAGVVEPAEWERGSWRYRVRTARIYMVVAFRSERHLALVTGWRIGR